MTESEPVYQLTESELDNLFYCLLKTDAPNTNHPAYENAYQSGREDGIRQFHKEVESKATVVVE